MRGASATMMRKESICARWRRALGGMLRLVCAALLLGPCAAQAQQPPSNAIDIPKWFEETFLVLPEDVVAAARAGKRIMLYFGQDGCPYCSRLMQDNFTQRAIVDKMHRHFVSIAVNVWGDREVVWTDGKSRSEKEFAAHLGVQFTPTLLFLDEKGSVAARINGYYPPHRFEAAIDYVAQRMERRRDFADYMRVAPREAASARLHDEPYFMKPPYDLRRKPGGKPLAVLFETPFCSACDELHRDSLRRPELRTALGRFDVARFALSERAPLTAPDGKKTSTDAWVRSLGVAYTPTIIFFAADGKEAFRIDSYLRPFHLAASFDYVASGAWRSQPSFQRFIQARAERMRERGERIELWQ